MLSVRISSLENTREAQEVLEAIAESKSSFLMKNSLLLRITITKMYVPGKTQRLDVGFGLFGIIFKLPKMKQKELALNSTDNLQLN